MNMYLTQSTGYGWNAVDSGPHSTLAGLKEAAIRFIRSADAEQIAAIVVVSSRARVGAGKSIKDEWITGRNNLTESSDTEVLDAIKAVFEAQGYESPAEEDDGIEDPDLDAILAEFTPS